ncbi:uncharacterized protein LOC100213193 isoform X1 [Hydra vulgaris]|uniref:uncharacterized protein LOC100213193 isoform X1 n=1 Tax=Hydra vulgaris TaxID=6087 RepID=UPI0002B4A9E1|nr:DEK domain-containing chromatin-associated protein 4 [Hydra vulgaris]
MGRRNVVKVDYSKFDSANGNSDEDDDFQEGTPPQKTKAKKLQKDLKKSEALKETKRKTRTSNADLLYQNDIITAIKVSVGEKTDKNKNTTKRKKTYVISDEEDDIPDTLPVEEKLKKPKKDEEKDTNKDEEEKDVYEEEEEKDDILTTSGNLVVSRLQDVKVELEDNNDLMSTKQGLNRKSKKVTGKSLNDLQPKKETSVKPSVPSISVPVTNSSYSYTDKVQISGRKVQISGRLRIGLSRNLRVTKPLHPGVNPNV